MSDWTDPRASGPDWAWWLRWTGVTAAGTVVAFVGFVAAWTVTGGFSDSFVPLVWAGFGAVLGAGQQWVLRGALGPVRGWAVATALGLALGLLVDVLLGFGERSSLIGQVIDGAAAGVVAGFVLGTAQWWVLRNRIARSRLWVAASAVGWALAAAIGGGVGYLVDDGLDLVIGPVVAAAVTGAVLVRLGRARPTSGVSTPDSPPGTRGPVPLERREADLVGRNAWIVANLVGFAVGGVLAGAIQRNLMQPYFEVVTGAAEAVRVQTRATGVTVAIFGAAVGLAQWAVVRRHLSAWWIPATCLGWALGGLAMGTVSALISPFSSVGPDVPMWVTVVTGVPAALLVGLLPGAFQWLVLRRRVDGAGWWPVVSMLGFVGGLAAAFVVVRWGLVDVVPWLRPEDFPSAKAAVLIGAVTGPVYGLVTWPVLREATPRRLRGNVPATFTELAKS